MLTVLWQIVLLVTGFALLIKGADWFVDGAAGIAAKFGVPQMIIGLTIVAMGTSAPEAAVSISSALKGSADIAVGNVLGSNNLNILLILGITSVICPLFIRRETVRIDIPFTIAISIVFAVVGLTDNVVSRLDGIILWALFIVYMVRLFAGAKKNPEEKAALEGETEKEEEKNRPVWLLLFLIALGLVCIVVGSNLAVDSASELARIFGLSERLIGVTIVAFGTSLPELATCVAAALKKNADIAVGNIIGSCIFNILFVLGSSALITPIAYGSDFKMDSAVAIMAPVLLLICVLNKDKQLKRWGGFLLLASYAGYFAAAVLL